MNKPCECNLFALPVNKKKKERKWQINLPLCVLSFKISQINQLTLMCN